MLELPTVSLIAIDSVFVERTLRAMAHCLGQVRFRSAFFFSDHRRQLPPGIVRVPIPRLSSREAFSEFMVLDLPVYREMLGDFVLTVQYDGFILDPSAWRQEFLDYDYIGAPWKDGVVGNGGFSLRSRRLLETLNHLQAELSVVHPEDEIIGRRYRERLEAEGVRFSPLEVARQFSVEDAPYAGSFGFHGRTTQRLSGFSIESILLDASSVDLHELYYRAKYEPSDIHGHIETLRRLGSECRHITEFGTRTGVSTAAFLFARPEKLIVYDKQKQLSVGLLENAAIEAGVDFMFINADVLQVEIEGTDLLFIDTFHVYEQVKRELARHADKVRKYLVFHDTTTFGERGELPGSAGIWAAIEEFVAGHAQWSMTEKYEHNNGLTILKRRRL